MIKVLFFAGLKEKTGLEYLDIQQPVNTVQELREWLINEYPAIETDIDRALMAVNEEFIDENYAFKDQDEVAFIPPVSGG